VGNTLNRGIKACMSAAIVSGKDVKKRGRMTMNKKEKDLKERKKLMWKYAELCGYNYPPFGWIPEDYTVIGWKKLIKDSKKGKTIRR
jgi:hypothetical protein